MGHPDWVQLPTLTCSLVGEEEAGGVAGAVLASAWVASSLVDPWFCS